MIHNFDTEIAEEYGLLESILLNHIYYWTEKNRANDTNFYDGNYWTYNSTRAFNELFPYASERQIKNALRHLRREGIIVTGNYNKSSYDRTLWYALSEKGLSIVQKCPMESTQTDNGLSEKGPSIVQKCPIDSTCSDNGLSENVPPIPDIYTNNKPDIYTNKYTDRADGAEGQNDTHAGKSAQPAPADTFCTFWEHYPNKQRRYLAEQAYCSLLASGNISHSDLAKCAQNYAEYVKITGSKTCFAGNFLTNRVFEDYIPGKYRRPDQGTKNDAKKSGFANFTQRQYDYAALEKQLLGGGRS